MVVCHVLPILHTLVSNDTDITIAAGGSNSAPGTKKSEQHQLEVLGGPT